MRADPCQRTAQRTVYGPCHSSPRPPLLSGARPQYAKAMAGGFTMSAVGGKKEIFDVLRDGTTSHSGTYNGQAVNVAAALATVTTLAEGSANGMYTRAHAHGDALREGIVASAARHGISASTTGAGTVFSVHFGMATPPTTYRELAQENEELYEQWCAPLPFPPNVDTLL